MLYPCESLEDGDRVVLKDRGCHDVIMMGVMVEWMLIHASISTIHNHDDTNISSIDLRHAV